MKLSLPIMSQLIQISILPEQQDDHTFILKCGLEKAKLKMPEVVDWRIRKRSIDARHKQIKLNLQLEFWLQGEKKEVSCSPSCIHFIFIHILLNFARTSNAVIDSHAKHPLIYALSHARLPPLLISLHALSFFAHPLSI